MKTIKLPHIEALAQQWKENPIVEKLEDSPIPGITKQEHVEELQQILVQTCLDYINKHGLTDIYSVNSTLTILPTLPSKASGIQRLTHTYE